MRRAFVALTAAAWLFALAPAARGHAALQSSDPAAGAELAQSPSSVTLSFTEEPELSLSTFRVLDLEGTPFHEGSRAVSGDDRSVRIGLKELPQGVYSVSWRVVSRVDGHLTAGVFSFGVEVSPSEVETPKPEADRADIDPVAVGGRWLLLAGFTVFLGGAVTGMFVFARPPRAVLGAMALASAASFAGVALLVDVQRRAAGVGLGDLASTFIGRSLSIRASLIVVAGIAITVAIQNERFRCAAVVVAGAAAAAGMLVHVAAGHAGAAQSLRWGKVAAQWVHFLAVGIWIGGLAAVVLGVRGDPNDDKAVAVRRFSKIAGVALFAVVATGVVRALNSIGSWTNLFSSGYGRVVLIKIGLLIGLVGLGAVNRYRNVPQVHQTLRGLRRVSRAELVLGVLVLIATAVLANLSPPTTAATDVPEASVVVTGSDFATTTRVRLEITPGDAGANEFAAFVTDFDSDRPVSAEKVSLRFQFVGDAQVGESLLDLKPSAPGEFRARSGNLLLDGRWRITVLVQKGADSTEVPIEFATRCRAEPTEAPDQPTLYDVRLPGGKTAQGYLDPGRAGKNEVHITFFDANGLELDVPSELEAIGSPKGEASKRLPARRLSAGHFVADAELAAAAWRFDFTATSAAGESLRACFEQEVRN